MKLVLFISFIACSISSFTQTYSFSGELVYRTETQSTPGKPNSQEMVRYLVLNEWVRVETLTPMGMQVFIRNFQTGEGVLLISMNEKNFALTQPMNAPSSLSYTFKKKKQKTKLAQLKARQGVISAAHLNEDIYVWYAKKIPGYFIDIYNGVIPGLPVSYTLLVKGEEVFYELVEFNQTAPDSRMFEIPAHYQRITMDEFIDIMTK
jgi:hypothetical protein